MGMVTGPFPEDVTARAAETEAARQAIEDAGLRREDVDGAVQARRSGGGGERATFSDAFPRILGLPIKFYYSVGRGGAVGGLALATAIGFLDLGIAKYVVIAGSVDDWTKFQDNKRHGHRRMQNMDREVSRSATWRRRATIAGWPPATCTSSAPPAASLGRSRSSSGSGPA